MRIKFSAWIFLIAIFAAACASSASTPQATHIIPTVSSTSTSATASVVEPKQKDMIFVEFFAGT